MIKHQSPVRLRNDINGSDHIENSSTKPIEQKIQSLENDHSSLMKKYEQLSKQKQDTIYQSSQNKINIDSQDLEQNRLRTPKRASKSFTDIYSNSSSMIQTSNLMLIEEKSKEERNYQQLVENYKITNRDLSQKLDQERQEVLDQRVKIHNLETEIKFIKKENQRLTSMINGYCFKNSEQGNNNIHLQGNAVYCGSSFGDLQQFSGETQNKPSQNIQINQSENNKLDRQLENKIVILEDQSQSLQKEKQNLLAQNKSLEEKITCLTLQIDQLKNILQNQQKKEDQSIKENQLKKETKLNIEEDISLEIKLLRDTIQQLKKEKQENSFEFQQKINQKNEELEKLLSLNDDLNKKFWEIEQSLKQQQEFIIIAQNQDKIMMQKEQTFIQEKERLSQETLFQSNLIKQLKEQMQILTKQQTEQSQIQKELQLINQEKETLYIQAQGQKETIQMLNQQIQILERISNEQIQPSSKNQSDQKALLLIKKELNDIKQKYSHSEKQIELLKTTNQNSLKQVTFLEEENQCLKLTKTESDDKNKCLIVDSINYLKTIDQLQEDLRNLNATQEVNKKIYLEKQNQDKDKINQQKQQIDHLQSLNSMFEKQMQNYHSQTFDIKGFEGINNFNQVKTLEERLVNLSKQNEIQSQKINELETKTIQQPFQKDIAFRRNSNSLLNQNQKNFIQSSTDNDEKYKTLQKSYQTLFDQSNLQLQQIDQLNLTVSELQKTIQDLQKTIQLNNLSSQKLNIQKNQNDKNQVQIISIQDLPNDKQSSQKNINDEYNSKKQLQNSMKVQQNKTSIKECEQQTKDIEKQQLVNQLQKENRLLHEKIIQVEQAFSQLNQKVETITKQKDRQNSFHVSFSNTPLMNQNNLIFTKQIKSAEKPPLNPDLSQSIRKSYDFSTSFNQTSSSNQQKQLESQKQRNVSSERRTSPNQFYSNNANGLNNSHNQLYSNFQTSPTRLQPDIYPKKRQNTLPSVFNYEQDFIADINYDTVQRTKTQETKIHKSIKSPNSGFNQNSKPKKNSFNEDSMLLFSPITTKDKKSSKDDSEDLLSNDSIDYSVKQMNDPNKNIFEFYIQSMNDGNNGQSIQLIKFDKMLFKNYYISKEDMLRYKQGIFLPEIVYVETKEGLQIKCTSQQQRDQDQIYINLNLFYQNNNTSDKSIEQLNVILSGSNTCQAFAKPTVSNWSLSPDTHSKQELFLKFNQIPFDPIYANVNYKCQNIQKKFSMYLPVNIVKFLEPRQITTERIIGKYLKIRTTPKNTTQQYNGFILKSERFYLDNNFVSNVNDFMEFLPHFQVFPLVERQGEYTVVANDFQIGGSYLLRENNLIFYMILQIKGNKYATFEIFSQSHNTKHHKICKFILQNFVYLFSQSEM